MIEYHPILTEKSQKTKTYRIANLFYVALFGGVFALGIIGSINARMLQIKGMRGYILSLSSFLCIGAKITFCALDANHIIEISSKLGFSLFKLADLLLFVVYYHVLKVPYRLHMIYHAEYQRMSYRGLAPFVCLVYMIIDYALVIFIYEG